MTLTLQFYHCHGWLQCSSSYYHGNDSNITMDKKAELILLKYLSRHQLISLGNYPTTCANQEFSVATQKYLQRYRLDDTSIVKQMKP